MKRRRRILETIALYHLITELESCHPCFHGLVFTALTAQTPAEDELMKQYLTIKLRLQQSMQAALAAKAAV